MHSASLNGQEDSSPSLRLGLGYIALGWWHEELLRQGREQSHLRFMVMSGTGPGVVSSKAICLAFYFILDLELTW